MSQHAASQKPKTVPSIMAMKDREKIVCLTAYTAPMAELLDEHVDILLVGDSLGMVLYGMESTLPVTLDMMIAHGKAVSRRAKRAMILIDMPFGSYQQSPQQAFENAAYLVQETNCQAVKMEGGLELVDTVRFVVERGIPVMAHIGLMPQHVHAMGGYRIQGRNENSARELLDQAKAFEEAGSFALLLEGIEEQTAHTISQASLIPTIGIGASATCDGQVLVSEDMLGLHERTPKFVKEYGSMRELITQAARTYAVDVKEGRFPGHAHCFNTTPSD